MKAATSANVRTTQAAKEEGQGKALLTAFNGGAVMGVSVASLGLIGLGVLFLIYGKPETASVINGFAMGASSIALFARVGGGIYTKAADVGADLVGKVEANIPEDDPRNPGVIADNVGDNVGDVAGMGADIFESYVGSIVATIAIGATLATQQLAALKSTPQVGDPEARTILMALPLMLAVTGLIASFVGIFSMKALKRISPASALRYATYIAAVLFLVGAYGLVSTYAVSNQVFWAILWGTLAGVFIGLNHRVLHLRQTHSENLRFQQARGSNQHHQRNGGGPGVGRAAGPGHLPGHLRRQRHGRPLRSRDRRGRNAGHGGH